MSGEKMGKAFERLFGKRIPTKNFEVNGRAGVAEVFALEDGSALAATADFFYETEGGKRSVSVEIMLAVKNKEAWSQWVVENGWEFKANFFATVKDFDEKMNGKGGVAALAWIALKDGNENVSAMAKEGLERVFGKEMLEEAILLDETPKASRRANGNAKRL